MWRIFWTAAGGAGLLVVFLAWVSNNTTFVFVHPRTKGYRVIIDRQTGGAVVVNPVSASQTPLPEGAKPGAKAPETSFHFGTMNPLTMGKHSFVIQNTGTAPLKLRVGPTTCKCTVSGLEDSEVAPGESTSVTLEWNTGRQQYYAHAGTIYTNDPDHEKFEFRIEGRVRMLVGIDDPAITLGSVEPGRVTTIERLIYSQMWDSFTITDLQTQITGLQWEVLEVTPADAPSLESTAVRRLRLTLPADLPVGKIADTMRLKVQPTGMEESHSLDLPFSARVPRGITVYGGAVDANGIVELGNIAEGAGKRVRLIVKLQDKNVLLETKDVEAFPQFLKVALEPHVGEQKGLYDLAIEVPEDIGPCQFNSDPIGRISIHTHHSRIGSVDLKVTFAIVPRRGL